MSVPTQPDGGPLPTPPASPSAGTTNPPGQAEPTKIVFHRRFALVTGIIALLLFALVALAMGLFTANAGVDKDAWSKLGGAGQFAVRLTIPMTVFGALLIAIGVWMAVVEWRGQFAPEVTSKGAGAPDISAIVEAIGKLRGAALVTVVGAVLMLGGAWVASSAVAPPAPPSTSTTAGS